MRVSCSVRRSCLAISVLFVAVGSVFMITYGVLILSGVIGAGTARQCSIATSDVVCIMYTSEETNKGVKQRVSRYEPLWINATIADSAPMSTPCPVHREQDGTGYDNMAQCERWLPKLRNTTTTLTNNITCWGPERYGSVAGAVCSDSPINQGVRETGIGLSIGGGVLLMLLLCFLCLLWEVIVWELTQCCRMGVR